MLKSELKKQITLNINRLHEKTVSDAIDIILATMSESLAAGKSIEIRSFGTFRVRRLPSRRSRNPKTGEVLQSGNYSKINFRMSKALKKCISISDNDPDNITEKPDQKAAFRATTAYHNDNQSVPVSR